MRALIPLLVAPWLMMGCGEDPPCGVYDEGGEVPVCLVGEEPLEFCPGDHWSDGCNSCGCDTDGSIICTERACDESQ